MSKTYPYSILIFILFFISISAFGQEKPVRLIEEVLKKRTIIYVQNDTDTEKSVFLKINPIGYRKSAQKPMIKNVPAKSKVQMTILIPLTNLKSSYTYNSIVNDTVNKVQAKRVKRN